MGQARVPVVSGPIAGGKGWAFGSPVEDVATFGYRIDEYFLEGDRFGNALGGVRLPDLMAPLGVHSGTNALGGAMTLSGRTVPFTPEQITETYADAATFLNAWDSAVDQLFELGLLLDDEVEVVKQRGRAQTSAIETSPA
jgi:hypothetical protein